MTSIIADQLTDIHVFDPTRYCVAIHDGDTRIGTTDPTTSQTYALDTLNTLRAIYPDSILQVSSDCIEWIPATDDLLFTLGRQHAAMVLARLITKIPGNVSWQLWPHAPNELYGYADEPEQVRCAAKLLGVTAAERHLPDGYVRTEATGRYMGVEVTVADTARPASEPAQGGAA